MSCRARRGCCTGVTGPKPGGREPCCCRTGRP
jgi:hypothetical protein